MEVKVTFYYLNKDFEVKCKDNDTKNTMYSHFIKQLGDGSDITHYIYYYDGNKLGHHGTISEDKYIGGKKEIRIRVTKKLRIIKCPKCICNDCIINLDNYLANFYGCKYNHQESIVYDRYINIQRIDTGELRCHANNCPNTQANYYLGFYKCLDCKRLTDSSVYFCKECSLTHGKDHKLIKYDKKSYYCEKHCKEFIKYCFTHKVNLCEDCVSEHEKDKIASYDLMEPKTTIDKIKSSLETMEKSIKDLQYIIEELKYKLDGALRIFKRYHYIAKDLIGKYELFNTNLKNYRILKSLRNLNFTNNKMNEDLKKIIDEKNIVSKANILIEIYETKEDNLKNRRKQNDAIDYSKDNDDDWWEESKKNEVIKNLRCKK